MDKINAKVFMTIAETGSFRRAADSLGYTQAGISYIVAAMEKETGLNLFVREHDGVRLSREGQELLPLIRQMEILDRKLDETVTELNDLKKGSVRIQIFDSISVHWIPGILRQFHEDYPDIDIDLITEEDRERQEEMVRTGEVDCGFFQTDVSPDIKIWRLAEENLLAIVPTDHPLAELERFPLKKIGKYPFISMNYDVHSGVGEIFTKRNVKPQTAYNMDNDYAAMAMVREGIGYGIFPELLLKNMPDGIKAMEFDVPQKRVISIGVASEAACSRACRKFVEYTRKWVEEQEQC